MDDNTIVRLFWERNETALYEISKKYGGYFVSLAERILYNHEDAKDCVNDAYFKTWDAIPPARPNILKAFVGKIVKCVAVSMLRANTAAKRGGGEITLIYDELEECISDNSSVENEFENKQIIEKINEYLWKCGEFHRRAFVLRYWHCESVSAIAERLGVPENKVSVSLYRTRRRLKEYLEKEGFEL